MAEPQYQPYATREDMQGLRGEVIDRMGQLEVRMVDRLGQMQSSMIKWIAGMLLAHLVAVVGLTVTLIKVIKP